MSEPLSSMTSGELIASNLDRLLSGPCGFLAYRLR